MLKMTNLRGILAACCLGARGRNWRPRRTSQNPHRLWRRGRGAALAADRQARVGKHYGKDYTIEGTRFTGSDKRAQAFEAGAIDIASSSANGVIFAAAEGVSGRSSPRSRARAQRATAPRSMRLATSPIKTVADMKGKTVAVNGFETSGHLWLKTRWRKPARREGCHHRADPVPGHGGIAALRQDRRRRIPATVRRAAAQGDAKVTQVFSAKDAIPSTKS